MKFNPVSAALLSYGMSGSVFHAPLLRAHPGFNLTHVVQRSERTIPDELRDVKICRHIDEVMQQEEVALVIVNTPNETHLDYASRALEAGKHVVVEKPFTVTTAEADRLINLASKKNRILTVFQSRRWDGDFMTVKQVVEKNLVGKIVEFEAHYDRFRNYVESNSWKEDPQPGVGILYNLGSHMLDQVTVLFGMPEAIDARMGIQRPGGRVDDYYDIRMQYRDMLVILKSSYLVREEGPRYTIHGVDGSFVKYGIDPQEQALKEKKIPGSEGWGKESAEIWGKLNTTLHQQHFVGKLETVHGNYLHFYDNVYAAIREGKPLEVKPEQARQVIQLIEACQESNQLRKAIKI
ncbi:MAG: Gfo/Idh/MocA family oxidoreductase [Cyclobacteriaceae bacterium]|nr:Gfo/Idh/MocA family oxidoreductase [Cyclobacteriaceae bacterium]